MAFYNESLRVHSTLDIETDEGSRQIQLLFGDITALPKQHGVDVLLISAFPGDYTPTRTSLIGALQHSLGIKVRDLASSREEDLRKQLHCWWSKPLPADKPFRRIMCFEPLFGHQGRVIRHPAELVGEVFRCLIPLCNNEEKTVLSPLLATGDANFSAPVMLRSMLRAAVSWIEAGLPMKRLGIVVYTRRPDDLYDTEKDLAALFDSFKTKIQKKRAKKDKVSMKFDIYVAYHDEDKDKVMDLCKQMQQRQIQLFLKQQEVDTQLEWQDSIHKKMLVSKRVVAFLSPAFLCSLSCIEKFNIALVCGHALKRDFLTPFLIQESSPLPTYIAMIQFVDCRTKDRQKRALPPFLDSLTLRSSSPERSVTQRYDVFISYAHANTDCAKLVLKTLADINPLLSVFYDRNELRAGSGWQKTLYNALDNSSVILALLSPAYIESQVCSEEYNIALANYLSDDQELELVAVQVKQISTLPEEFSLVPYTDASEQFTEIIEGICESINEFVSRISRNCAYFHTPNTINLSETFETWREQTTKSSAMNISGTSHQISEVQDEDLFTIEEQEKVGVVEQYIVFKDTPNEDNIDIAFIGGSFSLLFFIFRLLKYRAPGVTTNIHLRLHSKRLASIDRACLVVAFLGLEMKDTDLDELHVAIARHRTTKTRSVLYCIQTEKLPRFPTFLHLLPCHIALNDSKWKDACQPTENAIADAEKYLKQKIPDEVALILSVATDEIINMVQREDFPVYKNRTIMNMQKIIKESNSNQVMAVDERKNLIEVPQEDTKTDHDITSKNMPPEKQRQNENSQSNAVHFVTEEKHRADSSSNDSDNHSTPKRRSQACCLL